ncbi:MAG TPA: VWA domain-containing protein [Thermoanaerobaculia bacterium]|jgi:VWFA-related protein|nr:VWA domain-containing protein [Thermoanaerobaculia bacterium]
MSESRYHLAAGLGVCLLVAVTTPVGSQPPATAPPSSPDTSFREVIDVNIVNLTVRVTDKDGRPAKGLGRGDFEILEDGKPVEIANFYEISSSTDYERLRSEREASARSQAPALPPASEPAPSAPEAQAPPVRHVTIFVDNANIHPRNRQLVFRGLRNFLHDRTGPGDRIMVVSFHNDYEVVQPFTDSNADVVAAIDKLERSPSDGPEILAERRLVIRDLQAANLVPFSQNTDAFGNASARMRVESESRQILQRIDNHARETRQRTLNTLGVLRYLVGSMAGLPEPKSLLYLSDGLEMRAAETLFLAHYDRFNEISEALEFDVPLDPPQATIEEYDLTKEFTEFAKNAQTAGVVFFAIDASGQTDTLGGSAEFSMRDIGSAGASGYRPVWDPRLDILGEQNRQSTLRLLADETGGAVLANTRDYDAFFEDLRASLDNYYSLGFQAPHDREGRRHQIEVRVRQPGLKVSHQRAYVDKPWEARLSEQTVTTLILGAPMGDMTVQAIPGIPTPQDKKFIVPIQILVPVGSLGLVPDGKTHVANLSLTVVTKDAKGNTRPAQAMELRLRLTDEQLTTAANGEANIRLLLDAEPQQVGIGVRDRTSGHTATTMLSIDPRG